MYFYGLCLRNGYGVVANRDSARYWLLASESKGYSMAHEELMAKEPENPEYMTEAGLLLNKIKAAQETLPTLAMLANKYQKVEHKASLAELVGEYKGYLLKYDWGGKHIIEANRLSLSLTKDGDSLRGLWVENDTLQVAVNAAMGSGALLFSNMKYKKLNHYSAKSPERTIFQNATLKLDKIGDSMFLSGNLTQFIPFRKEPSKPLYLALYQTVGKKKKSEPNQKLVDNPNIVTIDTSPLLAYPNPFHDNITVDFKLEEPTKVETEILTLDCKTVYKNPSGQLEVGHYRLPVQTSDLATGVYLLVLHYGNTNKTFKVIKN